MGLALGAQLPPLDIKRCNNNCSHEGQCYDSKLTTFTSEAFMHRYILWEAEEQGLLLPYACRMGCCTACAVRVKEGEMYQPQVWAPRLDVILQHTRKLTMPDQ